MFAVRSHRACRYAPDSVLSQTWAEWKLVLDWVEAMKPAPKFFSKLYLRKLVSVEVKFAKLLYLP